ncbi:unnamed protein product [Orchesella dallaii]|uniref:C2H2-type domain-containing protein n=1 Tax=Orchesella dallaii TaxID=48710 RepID=A0ABP1QU38_9HEXA
MSIMAKEDLSNDGGATCMICSSNYIDIESKLDSLSNVDKEFDASKGRLKRAVKLFCKLVGSYEDIGELSVTTMSSFRAAKRGTEWPNDDGVGGDSDLNEAVVNEGFETEPPCCNECKNELLSVLDLQKAIEESKVSQRTHLEHLKTSLFRESMIQKAEATLCDDFWNQVRNNLISCLKLKPETNYFDEAEIKPDIRQLIENHEDNVEDADVSSNILPSRVDPVIRKRKRPNKQPPQNHIPNSSYTDTEVKVSNICKLKQSCRVIVERLKDDKLKAIEMETMNEITEGESQLGVRKSKFEAFRTLSSLRFNNDDNDNISPDDEKDPDYRHDNVNEINVPASSGKSDSEDTASESSEDLNDSRDRVVFKKSKSDSVPVERFKGYDESSTSLNDEAIEIKNPGEIAEYTGSLGIRRSKGRACKTLRKSLPLYDDNGSENANDSFIYKKKTVATRKTNNKINVTFKTTREKPVLLLSNNLLHFRGIAIKYSPVDLTCQEPGCSTIVEGTDYHAFQAIRAHISTVHVFKGTYTRPMSCPLCQKTLKGCSQLRSHLHEKHEPIHYLCEICWKPYTNINSVRPHMWTHKSEDEKEAARAAGQSSIWERQHARKVLVKHSTTNDKTPLPPLKKSKGYRTSSDKNDVITIGLNLLLYRSTIIEYNPVSFLCQGMNCSTVVGGIDFVSFNEIKDHISRVHSTDIYSPCPLCGTVLKIDDVTPSVMQHFIKCHNSSDHYQKFICESCWKPFSNPTTLKWHRQSHKSKEEKAAEDAAATTGEKQQQRAREIEVVAFTCEECGKTFKLKAHYKAHVVTHLPKELRKQLECTECGLKLLSGIALRSHIERKHKPELAQKPPRVCPVCSKRFHYRDGERYRIHVRGHTGERPFQCHICGLGFSSNRGLHDHRQKHDTNPRLRRFQCEFCALNYTRQFFLSRHKKSVHKDLINR